MDTVRYLDFELQFSRGDGGIEAQVLRSPGGEASVPFTMPFTDERLENLIMKMSPARGRVRGVSAEEVAAARELGSRLFESVFTGEVLACLRASLDEASREENVGLRIKLRLQDAPAVADLPWEYLYDPALGSFLAQSHYTPIVRYVEIPQRIRPLAIGLPIRILVMVSSPDDRDYAPLDVAQEKQRLRDALEPLTRDGRVELVWLETATLAELQRELKRQEYHVFHFVGHGGFEAGEGVLVLEDEQNRGLRASAYRIGPILQDHRSLRLAVLNSCQGARNSRSDPFAGMATSLIRIGIPAVVAMQFEISDSAAVSFAGDFYGAIAEGHPVDAAVAEARKGLLIQSNDIEWGTPVLYMRSPDGVLFDVGPTAATGVGAPPPPAEPPVVFAPPTDGTPEPPFDPHGPPPAAAAPPASPPSPPARSEPVVTPAPPPEPIAVRRRRSPTIVIAAVALIGAVAAALFLLAGGGGSDSTGSGDSTDASDDDAAAAGFLPPTPTPAGAALLPPTPTPARGSGTTPLPPNAVSGERVYFSTDRDHDVEIYAFNPDDTAALDRQTYSFQNDHLPSITRDGRRLVWVSERDQNPEVYVMDGNGANEHRLTDNPAPDLEPDISSDAQWVAFESTRDGNSEIYAVRADGSGLVNLTKNRGEDFDPAWSPDGKQIAFSSNRDGRQNLYVMNADGSNVRRLTSASGDDLEPAWSPDGKLVAFESHRDGNAEIYVMNADGSAQRRLTSNQADDVDPVFSYDGSRIFFETDRDGNREIYVMKTDGSGQTNLTKMSSNEQKPSAARLTTVSR